MQLHVLKITVHCFDAQFELGGRVSTNTQHLNIQYLNAHAERRYFFDLKPRVECTKGVIRMVFFGNVLFPKFISVLFFRKCHNLSMTCFFENRTFCACCCRSLRVSFPFCGLFTNFSTCKTNFYQLE